jgi:hypothetical protein
MKIFISFVFFSSLVFAQNVEQLQKQLLLEAEAAHAANLERLAVSPRDCLISLRQQARLKAIAANVSTLDRQGGLTHCPHLTDQDPQSASHKLWLEARQIEQGMSAAPEKLDNRTMWGKGDHRESAATFVRPRQAPIAPIQETKTSTAPVKRSKGPAPVENKKCEILILSGNGVGSSNTVPTSESCHNLCSAAKDSGATVRCYYGDDNITTPTPD